MKKAFVAIVVVAVLMVLSGLFGWYVACNSGETSVHTDTVRTEVIDTIHYYEPVPKDSVVLRYVTKTLPFKPCGEKHGTVVDGDTVAGATDTVADSVAIEIPITQKKYETEEYRAYVSGFEPNLDSIFVYQKTVNEKVVVTQQRTKQPRLGVGVVTGVGYGLVKKEPDAFIGLGFYLRW